MGVWIAAVPPYLTAAAILIIPGALVVLAGWGHRSPLRWLLAPAISVTLVSVAALASPFVGLRWSLLPVAIATAVVASVAFLLRRAAGAEPAPPGRHTGMTVLGTFLVVAAITTAMFARAFGAPDNIAQRFDNIVHLNAIALASQTGDASPFQIGATSDIAAYPHAWHAVTVLTADLTNVTVPEAVNAANLAFLSVLWTASVMALAGALFAQRRAAYVVSGALSTGFGAFPALFFNWGVLYPNVVGYAMVPAGLAATVMAFRGGARSAVLRSLLLVLLLAGGTGLGHPNAFLALLAFAAAYVTTRLGVRVAVRPTRGAWLSLTISTASFAIALTAAWAVARTSAEHSGWAPWQDRAQALGQAITVAPRGFTPTLLIVALLVAGAIVVARHPRFLPILAPFAVAVLLFVVASGLSIDSALRQWLTNPWYNDSNRLAALLPLAAIPVATLGACALLDAASRWAERHRLPSGARVLGCVAATLVVLSVAVGSNVTIALDQVREAYAYTDESLILSSDERELLSRLPQTTPEDALIIGSPRSGASLALAMAGRQVTERHVFGSPSPDLLFLDSHLRDIESDPQVCATVDRLGIDYVLDFGRRDVIDPAGAAAYDGVQDLQPGEHLVLVDSEGADARLFRIEGC